MEPKFLEITYEAFDLLINSRQVASGAALRIQNRIEHCAPYFDHVVPQTGASILVLDLARYLSTIFGIAMPEDASMVLLANTSVLSEAHQRAYQSLARKIGGALTTGRLGLLVKAAVRLADVPLRELRPLPSIIRSRCTDRGLLAFRFAQDGRIQYLFDIETVLFSTVGLPKEAGNESPAR